MYPNVTTDCISCVDAERGELLEKTYVEAWAYGFANTGEIFDRPYRVLVQRGSPYALCAQSGLGFGRDVLHDPTEAMAEAAIQRAQPHWAKARINKLIQRSIAWREGVNSRVWPNGNYLTPENVLTLENIVRDLALETLLL